MIPKKIHYCWVGGAPLPESAKKCIKSWRKYCPDYEIVEWNEQNFDFSSVPYMKEAYDAKKWGFVPDYARLEIVYTHGGIYLDTDVEIVRSFDPLLKLQGFAGFQDEEQINFGQGFGAEAGNPVLRTLMDSYKRMAFIGPDGQPNLTPSPRLNTDTLVEKCGLRLEAGFQELDGMTIFPPEYFCPKSFADGVIRKTKNTYSIHHFDASWFSDETKTRLRASWKHKQKRMKKLRRREIFGGFFRRIFGDERWERIKKTVLRQEKKL